MLRVLKAAVICTCAFVLLFLFIPTPNAVDDVSAAYASTLSYSANARYDFLAAYDLYGDSTYDGSLTDVRERVVAIAQYIVEHFGPDRSPRFSYSTAERHVPSYNSAENMGVQIQSMHDGKSGNYYISCCAFATYCWRVAAGNVAPYGTSCSEQVDKNFGDIIEGNGTWEYIENNIQPGDLIFRARGVVENSQPPAPYASKNYDDGTPNNYTHVMVYLGDDMVAHSSEPSRDVVIDTASTRTGYLYMVSLEKWLASNDTPVDTSGMPEWADEAIKEVS